VALALAVIPNDSNRPEHDYWWWNRIGMATWAATGGSEIGRVAFHEWSAKADKYDRVATESRWQHYRTSPPNRLGFGSLVYLARQHQPEWTHRRDSKIVKATPYVCVDPSTIPRRRWLYRPHYIRQFLSATFATGGTGKSSLVVVEALAMTSGKNLLGILPEDQLRVWYWNGEDPSDELQRSIGAAMKHYGLTGEHIEDRLFVDSGRTMPIVIAEDTRVGTRIAEPVIRQVIATLLENRIDVLIVDPFVSCHRVFENDNSAIDRVAKSWSHIAEVTNCAVMLVHHSRKTNGESVDVADGRGASALQDAVRMIRTLNVMTAKEAEGAEIEERHRRRFLRADLGKAKLTRPAEKADWFHLESVDLGNGPVITDPIAAQFSRGDDVGVVVSWSYPAVDRREPTTTDVTRVLEIIESNGPWRFDIRARNEKWVGIAVAEVLDLDVTRKPQRDRVAKLVDDWLQRGWLEKQVRQHPGTRKVHHYVVAGPVRPG
jgi:hypothetical protein